ncbi:MAG: type I glyceraldehyde-3-phosphate dehydrogenase [Mollicutes bacterium]|nr:type I glyceraldehyde-3-phosphate dehydrogenase [Mollicutes bacterium]MDD7043243.1 type I glyceraldehyde-3-phosphate dehydrogenase [Mollicutes bacterium]MDY6070411.1 type I glyceraldehyde-3-phosphate dehydrogenase [Bacilli bacterium]
MSIKLAINGFGRIGRLAFRRAYESGEFEVVAINDLVDAKTLAYLLKYDSTHRSWHKDEISADENNIIFQGHKIPVLGKKDPKELEWGKYGVDIVLECTGRLKSHEDGDVHLHNGAKGVIISAPSSSKDIPTYVYGVNTDKLTADQTIISGASCTTNCLAPVMKVLNDKFGVVGGTMTTVHAYTNDQRILDLAGNNLRRGRAAAANIVPTTTGAAKAIGKVIPELNGRLNGNAIRVPVTDGSLCDCTVELKDQNVTVEQINAAMKEAAEGELKGILGYNEDEIVSSDILGNTYGSIFDATLTMIVETPEGKKFVKVVAWYDNEYSFTSQYVRLAGLYGHILGAK